MAEHDSLVPAASTSNLIAHFDADILEVIRVDGSNHIDITDKPQLQTGLEAFMSADQQP
jgi:hypothetical protein